MKRLSLGFVFVFSALLFPALFSNEWTTSAAPQHGFSVKQYEDFHHVLHPLEHVALPNKDFRRIRARSALLVKRGLAIVKLGVPRRVTDANKEEFATELNKFREALARFKTDAKRGTNDQLKTSYSAVHDSFEMLAGMLPRK